jgi:hypothetical protein
LGWVNFTNDVDTDLDGQVVWTKQVLPQAVYYPSGFVLAMSVAGHRYVAPTNSANGIVNFTRGIMNFSSGNLTASFTNNIGVSWDGRVTNTSPNALSASINRLTGVFSGKVTVQGTNTVLMFRGAVLQGQEQGHGYFLSGRQSGLVQLTP